MLWSEVDADLRKAIEDELTADGLRSMAALLQGKPLPDFPIANPSALRAMRLRAARLRTQAAASKAVIASSVILADGPGDALWAQIWRDDLLADAWMAAADEAERQGPAPSRRADPAPSAPQVTSKAPAVNRREQSERTPVSGAGSQ